MNDWRWRKKSSHNNQSLFFYKPITSLFFFFLVVVVLFFFFYSTALRSLVPPFSSRLGGAEFLKCGGGEKFIWYAPHSGFSNQLSEFKNALLFAVILNRTLVVPPVLDHHAVALGSCPKFRVLSPIELRLMAWDHFLELARVGRYVSMADVVDISSVVASSMIKIIDFRLFASIWCGLNVEFTCSIGKLASHRLQKCRSFISGQSNNDASCVYPVQEDCRTTVWTYKQNNDDTLDSFQPSKELRRKKKISYVRTRRDVHKSLGPGSAAEKYPLLAFGSMFTEPYKGSELYIDIHNVHGDTRIQFLLQKIRFLPFVPEIMTAGRGYSMKKIKKPFLCAQLRLLDGQFKNHRESTLKAIRQKIQALEIERMDNNMSDPINIFVMTDLPPANWTGSYLADLANDYKSYRLHTLKEDDNFALRVAMSVRNTGHNPWLRVNASDYPGLGKIENCNVLLPDVLLFLEEAICSCASLGFVGTAGSTIAESIELMRKNNVCIS